MIPEELEEQSRWQEQIEVLTEKVNEATFDAKEWMRKYHAMAALYKDREQDIVQARDELEEALLRAHKAEDRSETLLLVLQHIVEGR